MKTIGYFVYIIVYIDLSNQCRQLLQLLVLFVYIVYINISVTGKVYVLQHSYTQLR